VVEALVEAEAARDRVGAHEGRRLVTGVGKQFGKRDGVVAENQTVSDDTEVQGLARSEEGSVGRRSGAHR